MIISSSPPGDGEMYTVSPEYVDDLVAEVTVAHAS